MKKTLVAAVCLCALFVLGVGAASASTPTAYANGFETDTSGWFGYGGTITRVASGTDGVPSATGAYHAEVVGGAFTRWGGYSDMFPTGGYSTAVDIYLNVAGGYANDTRFDWDSSISTPSGGFRRDFIFNCGYYNNVSATDPTGSGPRFVCSASNNSSPGSAYPKNPGRDPFTITTSGWYTFVHHFYNSGGGVLAVDLSIENSAGTVLHTWTLSDPTDIIGSTVGGNHYGWFDYQALPFLAIDNSALTLPCTTVCYVNSATGNDAYGGDTPATAKKTIQAAVDQVSSGGTVYVAPGTYAAVNVPAAKSGITLDGAEYGAAVGGRTFGNSSESTVNGTITVQASGVTIDGFSVTDQASSGDGIGVFVKPGGAGALIENNILDTITTSDTTASAQGVYLYDGASDVQIVGNAISDVQSSKSAKGIFIGDSTASAPSDGVTISGNTISQVTSLSKGGYGVLVNNGNGHHIGAADLKIEGNSFDNLSGSWVHAVGLEADVPNVLVDHNTFSSLSSPGPDSVAVWFESEDNSFPTGLVTRNSFDLGASAFGIAVDPALSGSVDGTCNWWGSASGPAGAGGGSGSPVGGQVGYQPWLTSSDLNGPCNGFSPLPGGKATCDGLLPDGTYTDVTVPTGATCTLDAGDNITHDVKVDKGGTLIDNGATIGHDLHANQAAGVTVNGGSIGHDVHVEKATGVVTIENASIGHDLHVQNNQGSVTVDNNWVGHDIQIQKNTPTTEVSGNSAGHDAKCDKNDVQTGSGNSAGHNNTCPATSP